MAGKPQTLSEGQKNEVVRLFWKKLLTSMLIFFAILGGITGWSLWEIKQRVEAKMEKLVAKQFEEPQIQEVVRRVAAERASALMTEQITPEVTKFKSNVNNQLKNLNKLVAMIEMLKTQSERNEKEIHTVLVKLKVSLEQNQNQLSTVKLDMVEMQKHLATIQYYQIAGINQIPNPYRKEMLAALNKLVAIAIPNHAERSKFIAELQDTQKPKK